MNTFKTLLAGAALAMTASAGNAAVHYATEVVSANYGVCTASEVSCKENGRKNVQNAIGSPESDNGKFYSLGFEGDLTLAFGKQFSDPKNVMVWEVTYSATGNQPPADNHREAVDVYAILGVMETFIGTLYNYGSDTLKASVPFEFIKLVDVTRREFNDMNGGTSSYDGFDVASVGVAPIPLPAAGTLLLAGLGGLAALRRRKTAA